MRVLDMALDYLSIPSAGKEKAIRLLGKKFQDHADISLTDIIRQEHPVTEEDIDTLRLFDLHLKTVILDRQFARMAVANGMASEADISDALMEQQAAFKKYRINLGIGEILLESRIITESDRISILLTQNRVDDENLMDALSRIGNDLLQKDAVNKRFGVLAIKYGLATMQQVNAALEIQGQEKALQGPSRFIGMILKETATISDEDLHKILLEQKQLEKRRLDLENALYSLKSEIKISGKLNQIFEYRISKDGTEAFVKKIKKTDESIPVYEFLIWLRRAKIKFGIVGDDVLETFIRKAEKNDQILVAKGYPAQQGVSDQMEIVAQDRIERGGLLARIIPGKEGRPGKDVSGAPILPAKPVSCQVKAGDGVIRKGVLFIALTDGTPVFDKDTICLQVPVESQSGRIIIKDDIRDDKDEDEYESADVEIFGNILAKSVLRCRSLLLHGNLAGSAVCSGEAEIKGEIGTNEMPKDTDAHPGASIVCEHSVKALRSVSHATIRTSKEFLGYNATVVHSDITATNGITIKDACGATTLQIGLRPQDKILSLNQTIESKYAQLLLLKKQEEIDSLTQVYENELEKEKHHLMKQAVLKNLVEILEAPELCIHEGLDNKIKYLNHLPDFSSIKSYYLRIPVEESVALFRNQMLTSARDLSPEKVLGHIRKAIDPEPSGQSAEPSSMNVAEAQYRGRLALILQEVEANEAHITKIEQEIKALETVRGKMHSDFLSSFSKEQPEIFIRNKCEKGIVIRGRIANRVVEKNMYNVRFKEIMDMKTNTVSITCF